MPNYNLSGLSTNSFENLIQAIGAKVLGGGIVIFGDGPDGGREATFEGKIPYPSEIENWDGYLVIQVKFLQRRKDTAFDGRWALRELKKELDAYSKKGRRKPDYYIFATNVVLSPVQDIGTKDKIEALFLKYQKKLSLRGTRVWDFDQISTYLDCYEDIRNAYSAWITPGDVLSQVYKWFKGEKPNFTEIMANFLAKELLADQFANIEQAGHSAEERINLARVFVDLPTSEKWLSEPIEDYEIDHQEKKFVSEILTVAKDCLSPTAISQHRISKDQIPTMVKILEPGRFVLIGGPGQGKTTVGQFICQLFRASILKERPKHSIPAEVLSALNIIEQQCCSEKIELPFVKRFPVRIVLNEFAVALESSSKITSNSFLMYILEKIKIRTDEEVTINDLRLWLKTFPWVLILDGLDEVPASSNRDEVLRKVEEFWIDTTQLNSDVLVIATTRPQGYNEDFSPNFYKHIWLIPLSVPKAMHYAQRLVEVRYGNDKERKNKIINRLRQASTHEATARLMRSPLQITIMTTLVDQIGQPPQDRWRLFHEYYQVIYRREMERDIPAAQLLRKHRKDIDIIHSRVALLLQMLSEKSGGTDARLSSENFKAIVDSRLSEEEFTGKERVDLRDQIIEAAANRLVFLVGLQAGQVGFEIRSFQEFLASEALMQGSDNDVQGRLREIAPIISWRNVFLFAAGRCFAEAQHLRDTIHTICVEMNEELAGPAGRLTLLGSRLSIDLLDDGVTHQQPKYAKLLARCAFQILDLPPSKSHEQLATTFYYGLKEIFKEEILNRIHKPNFKATLGSWAILLELINNGVDWAEEIGNKFWPLEHVKQREIFSPMPAFRHSGWYQIKYEEWIANGNSDDVWDFLTLVPRGKNLGNEIKSRNLREFVKFYSINLHGNSEARFDIKLPGHGETTIPLEMSLLSRDIENFNLDLSSLNVFQQGWVPFIEGLKFWLSPSKEKLSIAMHNIAAHSPENCEEEVWHLPAAMNLPWVYISCLKAGTDAASFHDLADKIASGSFGDYPDWLKAEKRWKEFGITIEDLLEVQGDIPFGGNIAKKGFPLGGYIFSSWRQFRIASTIPTLYKLYTLLENNSILRTELAANLFRYGIFHPMAREEFSQSFFTWNQIKEILKDCGQKINFPLELIILIQEQCKNTNESWIDFVEQLGNSIKLIGYLSPIHHDKALEIWEELGDAFKSNQSRKGLIPIIQKCLMNGIYKPFIGININNADFIEPDKRIAAVMIQLIQRELPQDAAEELAKITGELIPIFPNAVRIIVAMIESGEIFNEGIERFLLELNKHLKIDDIESKNNLNNCLQESLRRRKTKLAEPNTWKNHRLPEGVITLL